MVFNIKLDTTSEYCFDTKKWPEPICDVMIESLTMSDFGHMFFGTKPDEAYIDIYAIIEPERRIVTEFLVICKKEDGTQDETSIKVTKIADMVEYYMTLEYQGGEDFKQFIASACYAIGSERMSSSAALVEVVEDFLEERDIRIPTSDKEMIDAGDSPENNSSRIYGPDYDELVNGFEKAEGLSPEDIIKDRINYLFAWAMEYNPDELDFYTELSQFSLCDIERVCGKTDTDNFKQYCEEHGIEVA